MLRRCCQERQCSQIGVEVGANKGTVISVFSCFRRVELLIPPTREPPSVARRPGPLPAWPAWCRRSTTLPCHTSCTMNVAKVTSDCHTLRTCCSFTVLHAPRAQCDRCLRDAFPRSWKQPRAAPKDRNVSGPANSVREGVSISCVRKSYSLWCSLSIARFRALVAARCGIPR